MRTYPLYLESGPRHRKTMVHVPELLGCVATGPTTEGAIAATPSAIERFRRFLARHGEDVGSGPFGVEIVEHITEGEWLGNGSPYVLFSTDVEPVTEDEIDRLLHRFRWLREELAAWASAQDAPALEAPPPGGGRPAAAVLLHILGPEGAYLSAALGGAPGFSRLHGAAERGHVPVATALLQAADLAEQRVRAASPAQRAAIVERPRDVRTLRKALRRMLEHDWEHLAELAGRPGGPAS